MLDAALNYAALGYPVFPCWPGTKDPMTTHGFKDATVDSEQIRAWWDRNPDANIAIATEGLLVVDIDGQSNPWPGGDSELAAALESTPVSITPRGGRHHFFIQPKGAGVRNSAGKIALHLDVRANGGYAVLSPSCVNGKEYRYVSGRALDVPRDRLPIAPARLVELARKKKERAPAQKSGTSRTTTSEDFKMGDVISEGERNSTLASLAGGMRRRGMSQERIDDALREVNRHRCQPPIDDDEVLQISASICRYPPGPERAIGSFRQEPGMGLPQIVLDPKEHAVADEMIIALSKDPDLFQRGNVLVRVLRESTKGQDVTRNGEGLRIVQVPRAHLRERMTKWATIMRVNRGGDLVPAHPGGWLVQAVEARGIWPGIRDLVAVSDTPFMRPDGSICQAEGYDEKTHVLYQPSVTFPEVPAHATMDDARRALEHLQDIVCDFRFEAPEHFATWVASMLTVLARQAIFGPTPMFLVDANVRGAGKGLLLHVSGQILLGHDMPVSSYSNDNEEMRKKITTIAVAGDQIVLLDNIDTKFGNGAIDRAATGTRWKDRLLGTNDQADLPLTTVWFATGNNVSVAADTARRVLPIRLDVLEERPEERTGFKYPDLTAYVRQNRPRLLVSLLTMLRAYACAGFPQRTIRPYGSYEAWSNLVRQCVIWLGMADPCQGRDRLVLFSDTTAESLARLVDAWAAYDSLESGIVFTDLVNDLYPADRSLQPMDAPAVAMRAALEQLVGTPPGKSPTARQVANKVAHFRRRVSGGRFLDFNPAEYNRGGAVWRLQRPPADSGDASLRLCESG